MLRTWLFIASPSESHRPVFPWGFAGGCWVPRIKGGEELRCDPLQRQCQSMGRCKLVQEVNCTNDAWPTQERVRFPVLGRREVLGTLALAYETLFPPRPYLAVAAEAPPEEPWTKPPSRLYLID